jgi:hypothetical protein
MSRRSLRIVLVAGIAMLAAIGFTTSASAQETSCPAGGRGAAAGDAGRSLAGGGGLAFVVGGFATTGSATAPGGDGGSARGGEGGRGGNGTLPICNQNTNGADRPAAAAPEETDSAPVAAAAPAPGTGGGGQQGPGGGQLQGYGSGGGLARTGVSTNLQLALAGFALVLGGLMMTFAPAKQFMLRLVGATSTPVDPGAGQDWEVLGWSPPYRR